MAGGQAAQRQDRGRRALRPVGRRRPAEAVRHRHPQRVRAAVPQQRPPVQLPERRGRGRGHARPRPTTWPTSPGGSTASTPARSSRPSTRSPRPSPTCSSTSSTGPTTATPTTPAASTSCSAATGRRSRHRQLPDVPRLPQAALSPTATTTRPTWNLGISYSCNGLIEYKGPAFGGYLNGKILTTRYSSGKDIAMILELNPDGTVKQDLVTGVDGMTQFIDPLDLVEDPCHRQPVRQRVGRAEADAAPPASSNRVFADPGRRSPPTRPGLPRVDKRPSTPHSEAYSDPGSAGPALTVSERPSNKRSELCLSSPDRRADPEILVTPSPSAKLPGSPDGGRLGRTAAPV